MTELVIGLSRSRHNYGFSGAATWREDCHPSKRRSTIQHTNRSAICADAGSRRSSNSMHRAPAIPRPCGCTGPSVGWPVFATPETIAMQLDGPFKNGTAIDIRFTGEGSDVSPQRTWSQAPAGTKSFVLICDDPDAPSPKHPAAEPWVHWVIFNVPANVSELPEGVTQTAMPPEVDDATQGKISWPRSGTLVSCRPREAAATVTFSNYTRSIAI